MIRKKKPYITLLPFSKFSPRSRLLLSSSMAIWLLTYGPWFSQAMITEVPLMDRVPKQTKKRWMCLLIWPYSLTPYLSFTKIKTTECILNSCFFESKHLLHTIHIILTFTQKDDDFNRSAYCWSALKFMLIRSNQNQAMKQNQQKNVPWLPAW